MSEFDKMAMNHRIMQELESRRYMEDRRREEEKLNNLTIPEPEIYKPEPITPYIEKPIEIYKPREKTVFEKHIEERNKLLYNPVKLPGLDDY